MLIRNHFGGCCQRTDSMDIPPAGAIPQALNSRARRSTLVQTGKGGFIVKEGKEAPLFTLRDQNGKEHSLPDYRGSWVVLFAYPKANTSG